MKTYIIKSDEDLKQHEDEYGYHIKGNVEFKYSPVMKGRLLVDGYIQAGWSIKVGRYIQAGWSIEADGYIQAEGSIQAGMYIKAGGHIEAGGSIKAGDSYGILAGLHITCKRSLTCGLNIYAGICTWRETTDEDKTITCGKLATGNIEYGILVETGLETDKLKVEN